MIYRYHIIGVFGYVKATNSRQHALELVKSSGDMYAIDVIKNVLIDSDGNESEIMCYSHGVDDYNNPSVGVINDKENV